MILTPQLGHDLTPWTHDHCMTIAPPFVIVRADLRGSDNKGLCLDRSCSEKDLPVRHTGRYGECRRIGNDLCVLSPQREADLGETKLFGGNQ